MTALSLTLKKSSLNTLFLGLVAMVALIVALVVLLRKQEPPLPVISQISPFLLTNQLGQRFSADQLRGKVWIANIIFTHCPGPCREMTRRMESLQNTLSKEPKIGFLSLTADPVVDTPEVLHRYSTLFKADPTRWTFLTGPKAEIVRLAVDDLKLTIVEKEERLRESIDDLFIHSTISVVIDKNGRLRGALEVLEPGALERIRDMAVRLVHE